MHQEARMREDIREQQHLQDAAASQEIHTLVAQVRTLQAKTETNQARSKVGDDTVWTCVHVRVRRSIVEPRPQYSRASPTV